MNAFKIFLGFVFILSNAGYCQDNAEQGTMIRNVPEFEAFSDGISVVSFGYGIPNLNKAILKTFESYGNYKTSGFGPLHAKYEYALTDMFGLGLSASYASWGATWVQNYPVYNNTTMSYDNRNYEESFKGTSLALSLRYNVHFATGKKIDPYYGVGVGYKFNTYKYFSAYPDYVKPSTGAYFPVSFETTIGLRYLFSPDLGFYTEVGLSKSLIQAGLVGRL